LIVNGSGDTLAGVEEARWNYEAAKGPKELVVIESAINDPKRMEEAIANHVFQNKEKEMGFLSLFFCFAPCFNENEYSDYYENEACYAFDVIGRQWYARLVIGHQYGIDKQDHSEH
jgi:hypothetical protein